MITEKDIGAFKKAIKDFIEKSEKERHEKTALQLNRLERMQKELSKFISDIKRMKEKIAELETVTAKHGEISEEESAVRAEIEGIKKIVGTSSKGMAKLSEEMAGIRAAVSELQEWARKSNLVSDIEALKAREAIVETKLRQMDPQLIIQRLNNIETEIRRLKTLAPFIIE